MKLEKDDQMKEILNLNIAKNYDVNWNLEFIIRDYFQNYFDSVGKSRFGSEIVLEMDKERKYCSISGPEIFDWTELPLIGGTSKKDFKDRFAGGFGEGFPIATLCLLKIKPDITISQRVGNITLRPYFDKIGNREILHFEKNEITGDFIGSKLEFSNCDSEFIRIFSKGKSFFNFPENELFKEEIYTDLKNGISIFKTESPGKGKIFYRYQDRGTISEYSTVSTPFAICYDFEILKIPNSRDRIDLTPGEKKRIFRLTLAEITEASAAIKILDNYQNEFTRPNIVLEHLSISAHRYLDKIGFVFKEDLLANDLYHYEYTQRLLALGYKLCPSYFKNFGVKSAKELFTSLEKIALGEKIRNPTHYESQKFDLAYEFLDTLLGRPKIRKPLTVFVSALKQGEYTNSAIYLNERIFNDDFGLFLSVFLHEVSHEKGSDGSAAFTDILTRLIQLIITNHLIIQNFKKKWDEIHEKHLLSNNRQIEGVIIAHYDVIYHQKGCDCTQCEKSRFKSFGTGIFNYDEYFDTNSINTLIPLNVVYSKSFKESEKLCNEYAASRKWVVVDVM